VSNQPRKRPATKTQPAAEPVVEPDQAKVAAFLFDMGSKTDVEFVSAYAELAQSRPFIHPAHVVRILKLAALGLPDSAKGDG
jgi:hypothetical protein